MKYFSLAQINESLGRLASVHPFFLVTFLAAKKIDLPVGATMSVPLDNVTDQFLRAFYKLHPKSDWLFQPFKGSNNEKAWVKPNYSSTGLQSINTRTFRDAFDHPPGTARWGWASNYITVLNKWLRNRRIPLFHLAVWITRNTPLTDDTTRDDVVLKFQKDFKITDLEKDALFDINPRSNIEENKAFQEVPVAWNDIIEPFPMPPDVGPESESLLTFIGLQSLGPIAHLECKPAPRLNLITGDNGVGKTFFLDTVWWALTNDWVEFPISPRPTTIFSATPSITFQFAGTVKSQSQTALYDLKRGWSSPKSRTVVSSLVLYCRSDGAFSIWDPVRYQNVQLASKIQLDRDAVWFGENPVIEGLLRDLVTWTESSDKTIVDLFSRTLARLSPPEMQTLTLGSPVTLPQFSMRVPTLTHSYGEVPLVFESAGIKRMVSLAYLVVWTWTKHKEIAAFYDRKVTDKLVLLVDELEAHLHPKWQRTVLPALLNVLSDLSASLDSQIFVATHSPFVAASMEKDFRQESDKLFTLELQGGTATFEELEYRPRGPIDFWLTSPAFGLKDARSVEAGATIRTAVALQDMDHPKPADVRQVHEDLVKILPPEDRFWPRWLLFAKNNGVQL